MPLFGGKTQKPWLPQNEARFKRVRLLSRLLDEQFRLPGTTYRVGLDGLLGLIPGVGDAVGRSCPPIFYMKRFDWARRALCSSG